MKMDEGTGTNPADKDSEMMTSKMKADCKATMAECEADYSKNARNPTVGATSGRQMDHGGTSNEG